MSPDSYRFVCSFCSKKYYNVQVLFTSKKKENKASEIFICNECIVKCNASIPINLSEVEKDSIQIETMTPKKIYDELNQYIEGQEQAKRDVSLTFYNYFKTIEYNKKNKEKKSLKTENLLFWGPTGSGKSLIIDRVCKYLGIPYVIFDSTSLSQTGYVGKDINEYLEELYTQLVKKYPSFKKHSGVLRNFKAVVVFEEVDKLAGTQSHSAGNKDVSGRGVQQCMLRHIEGSEITFKVGQDSLVRQGNQKRTIDTNSILYIGVGAFGKIEELSKEKSPSNIQQFLHLTEEKVLQNEYNKKYKQSAVDIESFIKYGMMDELMGRFKNITCVERLTIENLKNILEQYTFPDINKRLQINNIQVEYTNDFLDYLAKIALNYKTGARTMPGLINNIIKNKLFDLIDAKEKGEIIKLDYINEEIDIKILKKQEKKNSAGEIVG